jgi:hypothetical protein
MRHVSCADALTHSYWTSAVTSGVLHMCRMMAMSQYGASCCSTYIANLTCAMTCKASIGTAGARDLCKVMS